jgi:hypothetical protein
VTVAFRRKNRLTSIEALTLKTAAKFAAADFNPPIPHIGLAIQTMMNQADGLHHLGDVR